MKEERIQNKNNSEQPFHVRGGFKLKKLFDCAQGFSISLFYSLEQHIIS